MGLTKEKIVTKPFALLFVARFFSAATFAGLTSTLIAFMSWKYEDPGLIAGVAVSIFVVGMVVSRIFAGAYVSLVGPKRFMVIFAAVYFVGTCLYYAPFGSFGFLVLRFVHGFAFGVITNTLMQCSSAGLPKSRYGEGVSLFSLSLAVGTAIGPMMGNIVMECASIAYLDLLFCVFNLLALIAVSLYQEIDAVKVEKKEKGATPKLSDAFEAKALPASIIVLLHNVCYISITTYVASLAGVFDVPANSSVYFISYSIFLIIFRPLAGKLMDRIGDIKVYVPTTALYVAGLLMLAFSNGVIMLFFSAMVVAAGQGCAFSSLQTIATRSVEKERLGAAISTYYVLADVGLAAGPVTMGIIVDAFGVREMYMACAVLIFCTLVATRVLRGKPANK